ncbi:hypothetical protein [Gandjariella thermophila]|nr:hypothetical protein [Gandjariella thermophila]
MRTSALRLSTLAPVTLGGRAGGADLLRAGGELAPAPMTMTAVLGGRPPHQHCRATDHTQH